MLRLLTVFHPHFPFFFFITGTLQVTVETALTWMLDDASPWVETTHDDEKQRQWATGRNFVTMTPLLFACLPDGCLVCKRGRFLNSYADCCWDLTPHRVMCVALPPNVVSQERGAEQQARTRGKIGNWNVCERKFLIKVFYNFINSTAKPWHGVLVSLVRSRSRYLRLKYGWLIKSWRDAMLNWILHLEET